MMDMTVNWLKSADVSDEDDQDKSATSEISRPHKMSPSKIIIIFVAIIISVVSLIYFVGPTLWFKVEIGRPIKYSHDAEAVDGYAKLAAYLRSSMDLEANPCEDFHQYICGHGHDYLNSNSSSKLTSIDEAAYRLESQLKRLVEDRATIRDDLDPNDTVLRDLRSYYDSCANETRLTELGAKPLLELIHQLENGTSRFPILDYENHDKKTPSNWTDKTGLLLSRLRRLRSLGIEIDSFLFELQVEIEPVKKTTSNASDTKAAYRIYLGPKKLDKSESMFLSNKTLRDADLDFMLESFEKLGIGQTKNRTSFVRDELVKIQEFRRKLLQIRSQRFVQYKRLNMLQFALQFYLEHSYSLLVKKLFEDDGRHLTKDDLIYVELNYLRQLDQLLFETPTEIVDNFILYRLIQLVRNQLDASWQPEKLCLHYISELTSEVVYEIVKNFVDVELKGPVHELATNIHRAATYCVRYSQWISDLTTQNNIIAKFADSTIAISHQDKLLAQDAKQRSRRAQLAEFDSGDFFGNYLRLKRLLIRGNYAKETQRPPTDQLADDSNRFTIVPTAFYSSGIDNMLVIPASMIFHRFYNRAGPQYLNYAGLGQIIAHEMGHMLDSGGAKYDQFRKLNSDWWDKTTQNEFELNKQCLIKQYQDLPLPGAAAAPNGTLIGRLNGTLTLDENMADNYGIKIAFAGYRQWITEQEFMNDASSIRDKQLDGFNFTQEQLFWVSYATTHCKKSPTTSIVVNDQEFAEQLQETHSPAKYRINIPLANTEAFAKAFKCPLGSAMNPLTKCRSL